MTADDKSNAPDPMDDPTIYEDVIKGSAGSDGGTTFDAPAPTEPESE